MLTRGIHQVVFGSLLLLLVVTGCSTAYSSIGTKPTAKSVSGTTSIGNTSATPNESTVNFTLFGGNSGSYSIRATLPTSKLRHGHREFTIDVEHAGMSVFLVFYGYQGPDTYTLAQNINGGDIHIALGKDTSSWDLSLEPKARCTMTIQSDTPTQSAGLDRMKGSFSCPVLFSSNPNHPEQPVSVSSGTFDVTIIVES